MPQPIFILGGAQSDFAVNCAREGIGIDQLIGDTVAAALDSAQVDPTTVDVAHVGNFTGELFNHQGLLGGVLAEVVPAFRGIPTSRHEAACASGSMAALAASAELEAGRYDLAAVVGVELMRCVPGQVGAEHLGVAVWHGHEATEAEFPWPHMFNALTEEYAQRYGIDYAHIGAIAAKNFDNASRNPNAQTRRWSFEPGSFSSDDTLNPVIDGQIRKNDCGQITDGAAVLFLASERAATDYCTARGLDLEQVPRILGWGHRSARIAYAGKVADSREADYVFPTVRQTIEDAFRRADIEDVFELDAIETHDCFAITEYMAMDHFGITAPGQAWRAIEAGTTSMGGRLPVNPSGGLIGLGHPVGATGVRMLLDASRQVAGTAGDTQVGGAKRVGTLNIGGSTTTTASFVVGVD